MGITVFHYTDNNMFKINNNYYKLYTRTLHAEAFECLSTQSENAYTNTHTHRGRSREGGCRDASPHQPNKVTHTHTPTRPRTHTQIHLHKYTHKHTHPHTHTYPHAHPHTRTPTHTPTHTHTHIITMYRITISKILNASVSIIFKFSIK